MSRQRLPSDDDIAKDEARKLLKRKSGNEGQQAREEVHVEVGRQSDPRSQVRKW